MLVNAKQERILSLLERYMEDCVNHKAVRPCDRAWSTIYIGRAGREGSRFGNPWPINRTMGRKEVIWRYLEYVHKMPPTPRAAWLKEVSLALRFGKFLRCFCAPELCHGTVLSLYARNVPELATIWSGLSQETRNPGWSDLDFPDLLRSIDSAIV